MKRRKELKKECDLEDECDSADDEKDEKKEQKKEAKKEYDLDLIICENWWYKINKLAENLNKFMVHCISY